MKSTNTSAVVRAVCLYLAAIALIGFGICRSAAAPARLRGGTRAQLPRRLQKPLSRYELSSLPTQRISKEQAVAWLQQQEAAARGGIRAAAGAPPPPTITQFVDLTTNPHPPLLGDSTKCQEIHPAWAWDQQRIYFASNNIDDLTLGKYGVNTPSATAPFHVYWISSDGAFITQLTGQTGAEASATQLFPAVNHALTKVAYANRARVGDPFQLWILDLNTGARTQVTGLPSAGGLNAQIVSVEHPSWAPGDNFIAFAARNVNVTGGDVRNIYVVNTTTGVVSQLTQGTLANGVESIDPVFHPSGAVNRICFAANTGNPANGPAIAANGDLNYVANPLQDLDQNPGTPAEVDHNLFSIPLFGPSAANPIAQLTTDTSDDIEPAYEQGVYPPGQGTSPFNGYLAWSSKGRLQNGTTTRSTTYDIYFNDGTDEATFLPVRLFTPDTNGGSVPLNQTDERYPTWSSSLPPQNPIDRIVFSSNRRNNITDPSNALVGAPGDTDLWAAEVTDITPPTLFPIEEYQADLEKQFPGHDFGFLRGEVLHIANRPIEAGAISTILVRDVTAADTVINVASANGFAVGDFLQTDAELMKLTGIAGTAFTVLRAQASTTASAHLAGAAVRKLDEGGSRTGIPGEPFYFYAKVKDLQYGIESVWLQIKDPDGPSTDWNGQNHKLYGVGSFPSRFLPNAANNTYVARYDSNGAPKQYIHLPFETDYEGIGVSDYQYYSDVGRFDQATIARARYASKSAGVDDSVRWSGNQNSLFNPGVSNRPPLDGNGNPRWLRLHDDGIYPDLKPNDGIFSAQWTTPTDPSDFYVDLIAYDKAFNPRVPSQQENWIVYDNIWGFTTQPFLSHNPVLFVDDNGAGQKWPRGLKGSFRTFPSFRFGTESDIADRPQQFWPRQVISSTGALVDINSGHNTGGVFPDIAGVLDAAGRFTVTAFGQQTYDFLTGDAVPYDYLVYTFSAGGGFRHRAYRYDMWRILARGAVPDAVLNDYLPVKDEQPDHTDPFNKTTQQLVPKRAVLWNSPYTGDIFLGSGSILDQAVQNSLTTYRNRGGRLAVAGGDIAWALTVDGTVTQNFLSNVLGAKYIADTSSNPSRDANHNPFRGGNLSLNISRDVFRDFNNRGTPPYWGDFRMPDEIGTTTDKPGMIKGSFVIARPADILWNGNPILPDIAGNGAFTYSTDGTPFEVHDTVAPVNANWEEAFQERMLVNADAANGSKTVFMSFSLASLGRRYTAESDDDTTPSGALDCMNFRAKISHAMFCWMFSADLVGQIKNLNGGAPIAGALVEAIQGGNVVGSAFTRTDGTYIIRGLPIGGWSVRIRTPGFSSFMKDVGSSAHGLDQSQLDAFMSPAAPGSISGKVVDQFGNPVGSDPTVDPGRVRSVRIKATIQASPLYTGQRVFTATTNADGAYIIPNLPTASYDVQVDQLPPHFTNPVPKFTNPVTVNPAQDTPGTDFTVTGQPGPLTVKVFSQLMDGTKGPAIQGAEVTILDSAGKPVGALQGLTDAAGTIQFDSTLTTNDPSNGKVQQDVPAGSQQAAAFKFGFRETTVPVLIPQQDSIELLLPTTRTDLILYGRVIRASDRQPVSATDLPITLKLLRPSGLDTGVSTDVFAPVDNNPVPHNYVFNGVQDGTFKVALRGNPRYQDTDVTVTVAAGVTNLANDLEITGRPGKFFGVVREDNAGAPGAPLAGVTVNIVNQRTGKTTSAATAADGTWDSGSPPLSSDLYTLSFVKFGYTTKVRTDVLLAGDTDTGTTLLKRAARGIAYGLVTRSVDGRPLPDVTVSYIPVADPTATPVDTVTFDPPTTAPDGGQENYTLGSTDPAADNLPEGDYDIKVNDPHYQPFTVRRFIKGGEANRVDIALVPKPGVLTGEVLEFGTDLPISGAVVTVTQGTATKATTTTAADGSYRTIILQPGPYTVTASAPPQFETDSVTVFVAGDTVAPTIRLRRVPPSVVAGTLRSTVDGAYIGGATLDIITTDGTGRIIATTTSTDTALTNPVGANFRFDAVPPGSYTIRATKPGWQSTLKSILVNPRVDLLNVALTMAPDHVFGAGLSLISLPEDFPGQDAATVLGKSPATFKSAYWLTSANTYAIYPDPEAAEFRRGKGMFVRFDRPTAFAKVGIPAGNAPFSLPVRSGWNLIGSVRRIRIEWLRVKVVTGAGETLTMQQAMDRGIIQNGLFAYQDGYIRSDFMDPFTGYFMRAFQDCTLVIPVDNSAGFVNAGVRSKAARHPAPSAAQAAAELQAAGLAPASINTERKQQPTRGAGSLFGLPERPLTSLIPRSLLEWAERLPRG